MDLSQKMASDFDQNRDLMQSSGDWFKIQEGSNQVRILVEPEVLFEKFKVGICYTDCGYQGTPKYLAWILDRADGRIKLFKMPMSIFEDLAKFQKDDDYKFSDFPMPYDLKIEAKNAGTKEVTYTLLPKPVSEIDPRVLTEVAKQKSIADIIQAMKDKQKQKHMEDGTWDANQAHKAELAQERDAIMANQGQPQEFPDEPNPEDVAF